MPSKAPVNHEKAADAILQLSAMSQMPLRQPLGTWLSLMFRSSFSSDQHCGAQGTGDRQPSRYPARLVPPRSCLLLVAVVDECTQMLGVSPQKSPQCRGGVLRAYRWKLAGPVVTLVPRSPHDATHSLLNHVAGSYLVPRAVFCAGARRV